MFPSGNRSAVATACHTWWMHDGELRHCAIATGSAIKAYNSCQTIDQLALMCSLDVIRLEITPEAIRSGFNGNADGRRSRGARYCHRHPINHLELHPLWH